MNSALQFPAAATALALFLSYTGNNGVIRIRECMRLKVTE